MNSRELFDGLTKDISDLLKCEKMRLESLSPHEGLIKIVISKMADYVIERIKEENPSFALGLSENGKIDSVMVYHLKTCHPEWKRGNEWYKNLRCPTCGEEKIVSVERDIIHNGDVITWECGCKFLRVEK
jgi:hypothetical protein